MWSVNFMSSVYKHNQDRTITEILFAFNVECEKEKTIIQYKSVILNTLKSFILVCMKFSVLL